VLVRSDCLFYVFLRFFVILLSFIYTSSLLTLCFRHVVFHCLSLVILFAFSTFFLRFYRSSLVYLLFLLISYLFFLLFVCIFFRFH
jgi:hypothetical protein